jgi:anti-sigma regulatory factor (Ser/Thr protein kinase)
MKELSLNVLDLAQNSLSAGARHIAIEICESLNEDSLRIRIADDGAGMDPDFLERVTDPFVTTRTTRPVGMGIPLIKMAAEMAEGQFDIRSKRGEGTELSASFRLSHVDRMPLGDIAGTITTLIQGAPEVDYTYIRSTDSGSFEFDTRRIREMLEGISLREPEILDWIKDYITQGEAGVMAQNI